MKETRKTVKNKDNPTPKKTGGRGKKNPMGTAFDAVVMPTKTTKTRTAKNRTSEKAEKSTVKGQAPKKRVSAPRNSNKNFEPVEYPLQNTPIIEKRKTKTEKARTASVRTKKKKSVKILFLGGVGEIGKNMTAIEYDDDIIIIDAGLTFPNSEDMPGVDSVVPDISYLAQNKDKIRGVLLTHGHEDHIGGVPYLMKEISEKTPIFGTKLTLMLTDNKLQEHHIQNAIQRVVVAGERVKLGAFEVEFINVNHSISGACALAIRTPNGLIYHSGDFKIDLTPVAGEQIDLKRIAELGKEGVLLYMSESTNIERAGYTMSETVVGTTLDHLFSENTTRRIIIATFASNVYRIQQILNLLLF